VQHVAEVLRGDAVEAMQEVLEARVCGAHGVRAYPQDEGSGELMSKDAESRGRIWFMAGKVF
jgi:hypothetical protein